MIKTISRPDFSERIISRYTAFLPGLQAPADLFFARTRNISEEQSPFAQSVRNLYLINRAISENTVFNIHMHLNFLSAVFSKTVKEIYEGSVRQIGMLQKKNPTALSGAWQPAARQSHNQIRIVPAYLRHRQTAAAPGETQAPANRFPATHGPVKEALPTDTTSGSGNGAGRLPEAQSAGTNHRGKEPPREKALPYHTDAPPSRSPQAAGDSAAGRSQISGRTDPQHTAAPASNRIAEILKEPPLPALQNVLSAFLGVETGIPLWHRHLWSAVYTGSLIDGALRDSGFTQAGGGAHPRQFSVSDQTRAAGTLRGFPLPAFFGTETGVPLRHRHLWSAPYTGSPNDGTLRASGFTQTSGRANPRQFTVPGSDRAAGTLRGFPLPAFFGTETGVPLRHRHLWSAPYTGSPNDGTLRAPGFMQTSGRVNPRQLAAPDPLRIMGILQDLPLPIFGGMKSGIPFLHGRFGSMEHIGRPTGGVLHNPALPQTLQAIKPVLSRESQVIKTAQREFSHAQFPQTTRAMRADQEALTSPPAFRRRRERQPEFPREQTDAFGKAPPAPDATTLARPGQSTPVSARREVYDSFSQRILRSPAQASSPISGQSLPRASGIPTDTAWETARLYQPSPALMRIPHKNTPPEQLAAVSAEQSTKSNPFARSVPDRRTIMPVDRLPRQAIPAESRLPAGTAIWPLRPPIMTTGSQMTDTGAAHGIADSGIFASLLYRRKAAAAQSQAAARQYAEVIPSAAPPPSIHRYSGQTSGQILKYSAIAAGFSFAERLAEGGTSMPSPSGTARFPALSHRAGAPENTPHAARRGNPDERRIPVVSVPAPMVYRKEEPRRQTQPPPVPPKISEDIEFIKKTVRQSSTFTQTRKENMAINLPGGSVNSAGPQGADALRDLDGQVNAIADKVYNALERRLRSEKMRRGLL